MVCSVFICLTVAVGQQWLTLLTVLYVEDYMMSGGFRKSGGSGACDALCASFSLYFKVAK